jgi:hypothetical protein
MLNDTRTHVQSSWEACNLRIRNRKWTYKDKKREWSKDARYTENEETGYESISADRAVTAFISFRCLKPFGAERPIYGSYRTANLQKLLFKSLFNKYS